MKLQNETGRITDSGNVTLTIASLSKNKTKQKPARRTQMMKHQNIISRYTLQVPELFKKNNIELFGALEKILQSLEGTKIMLVSNIFLMTFNFRI